MATEGGGNKTRIRPLRFGAKPHTNGKNEGEKGGSKKLCKWARDPHPENPFFKPSKIADKSNCEGANKKKMGPRPKGRRKKKPKRQKQKRQAIRVPIFSP